MGQERTIEESEGVKIQAAWQRVVEQMGGEWRLPLVMSLYREDLAQNTKFEALCVTNETGDIKWVNSKNYRVVSIDGLAVADLATVLS